MDLPAREPPTSLPVERTATGSHNEPAFPQHDLAAVEPTAIDPDLLQVVRNRVARKEVASCSKTQTAGIARLQLRPPSPGIAQNLGFEPELGLVDRPVEVRCRTHPLRHTPQ